MKICLDCYTTFQRDIPFNPNELNGYTVACPIFNCGGEIVEIDDNFFEAVKILNQKDYRTKFCCSGHLWSADAYVFFDDDIKPNSFKSLPKDFIPDKYHHNGLTIRRKFSGENTSERLLSLATIAADLTTWAEELKPSLFVNFAFRLKNAGDDEALAKKIQVEYHTTHTEEYEHDGNKYVSFDMTVAPDRIKTLIPEVRSFATSNGSIFSVERY